MDFWEFIEKKDLQPGTIFKYSGREYPPNYCECNGIAISREKYKELFDVIGEQYGAGDGVKTFNIPSIPREKNSMSIIKLK